MPKIKIVLQMNEVFEREGICRVLDVIRLERDGVELINPERQALFDAYKIQAQTLVWTSNPASFGRPRDLWFGPVKLRDLEVRELKDGEELKVEFDEPLGSVRSASVRSAIVEKLRIFVNTLSDEEREEVWNKMINTGGFIFELTGILSEFETLKD